MKAGIIGCGVIAPLHAKCLQQIDGIEPLWACDLVADKARAVAEEFDIPNCTTDYTDVLQDDDVDCVHVCTDHGSHAAIAVAALDAGKHVICEKALSAAANGLQAMEQTLARHDDLVFVPVFQHRFDPVYRRLKALVDEGALGTVLTAAVQVHCLRTDDYYRSADWRGTWAQEGGAVLINQAIHFVDALVWAMGGVKAVSGAFANLTHADVMETEDTVTAALRFRSGALGTLEATCSSNLNWEPTLAVHGSQGAVELRNAEVTKLVIADDAVQQRVAAEFAACGEDEAECQGKSYYGPSHSSQIADFVEAIRDGRQPYVSLASARHTVDVVHAIYESARQQRWLSLSPA
jgi:predicted dehydrogenase